MAERETEFKYLLSDSDVERLQSHLGAPERVREFLNRYFCVEGGTTRQDWVLRLRVEEPKRTLTLKIGREVSPGLFDSEEFSVKGVTESLEEWENLEPLQILRREISKAALSVQGEMRNRREIYSPPLPIGEYWELDEAELPGGETFRELEVEVQGEERALETMRAELEEWMRGLGLVPKRSESTKYARFLKALEL